MNQILFGDCRDSLRQMSADGVRAQTCVTSPPYFGLRDYGHAGQIGLEKTPEEYVAAMVEVFRCVRDVLADDGTLWLNIGDSYATRWSSARSEGRAGLGDNERDRHGKPPEGFKNKDLIGIPWMLAFALRADGWYLRQDIIWHKPNPMPESVRDRCTKAHEYVFLMSKSERYLYDAAAVMEPLADASVARLLQANLENQRGSDRVPGKTNGRMKAVVNESARKLLRADTESRNRSSIPGGQSLCANPKPLRNRRSVWTVTTRPYKGAHFATFPPALIEPCILAGSRPGDIVLDPFIGSGTTAEVAILHGRRYAGCELNPDYKGLQDERIAKAFAATARSVNKPCMPQKLPSLQFDLLDSGDGIDVRSGIVTPSCVHADPIPKIDAARE